MLKALNYQISGQGLPLVFIHGWGVNSAVWQPLTAQLTQHYQVITIDLPGFGRNVEQSLTDYNLANISQLITTTIKQPAIYIGWSLGGLVATHLALHFPQQVKGLVTVASSPYFMEQRQGDRILWHGIKKQVLQHFYLQLEDNIKKTLVNFLKIQAMGSANIRQDIKQLQSLLFEFPMPSKQTLALSLALLESADLREDLAKITQPFLRFYGRLDSLVPKASIALINQLSPNSDYYIFNKASHAPFISHTNEFKSQLESWLNTHFIIK